MRVDVKPLSVNFAWQGKRFKTRKYRAYERELFLLLKTADLSKPPYEIKYRFGMSKASDIDNPIKPFQDILQKYYGFNDNDIYRLIVEKEVVKKGKEFIEFEIKEFI